MKKQLKSALPISSSDKSQQVHILMPIFIDEERECEEVTERIGDRSLCLDLPRHYPSIPLTMKKYQAKTIKLNTHKIETVSCK